MLAADALLMYWRHLTCRWSWRSEHEAIFIKRNLQQQMSHQISARTRVSVRITLWTSEAFRCSHTGRAFTVLPSACRHWGCFCLLWAAGSLSDQQRASFPRSGCSSQNSGWPRPPAWPFGRCLSPLEAFYDTVSLLTWMKHNLINHFVRKCWMKCKPTSRPVESEASG